MPSADVDPRVPAAKLEAEVLARARAVRLAVDGLAAVARQLGVGVKVLIVYEIAARKSSHTLCGE